VTINAAELSRLRLIAGCWMGHGTLLLMLAAMIGPMAELCSGEDWSMAMVEIGAGDMVASLRSAITAFLPMQVPTAILGGVCLAAGAWTWLRWSEPARWTLQVLAAMHLIAMPWLTWYTHGTIPGVTATISEIITLLITEAGIVYAMVITHRVGRLSPR